MAISIDTPRKDREAVARQLSKLLADTYSLYLKTHSFHRNAIGPQFNSLHTMFKTQYNARWLAADKVAERIRAASSPRSRKKPACRSGRRWRVNESKATKSPPPLRATPSRPPMRPATRARPTWPPPVDGAREDRVDAAFSAEVSRQSACRPPRHHPECGAFAAFGNYELIA